MLNKKINIAVILILAIISNLSTFIDSIESNVFSNEISSSPLAASSSKTSKRWRRHSNQQKINQNQIKYHSTQYIAECDMPTDKGNYKMRSYDYTSSTQKLEPIVMISGDVRNKENVLVRVHDSCFTSEVFGSKRCDCKEQLDESLELIKKEDGIVIYLQQEGRGIGISNKVAAYALQDKGMDTVDANISLGFEDEGREYFAIPDILNDLGIKSIKLLTNNPYKIEQLTQLGIKITERRSIEIPSNPFNHRYLRSKKDKMRHFLSEEALVLDKTIEEIISNKYYTQQTNDDLVHSSNNNNAEAISSTTILEYKSDILEHHHFLEDNHLSHHKSSSYSKNNYQIPNNLKVLGGGCISNNDYESDHSNNVNNIDHINDDISGISKHKEELIHDDDDSNIVAGNEYVFGKQSVEAAIESMRKGDIVIVVDDANRENEGDFIMAAEKATPDKVGFIIRYSSGVLCISLEGDRLDELALPPMVNNNEDPKKTAYSVSVDYKYGTSTGISSYDRALTFRKLVDPTIDANEFQRPGHVFPLRYSKGGVLVRRGHTEASLDLSKLAKLKPGAILCEIIHDNGSMMRLNDLEKFSKEHNLVLTSVQDIIAYRLEIEK